MIPGNELSTAAAISGFSFPVKGPGDLLEDWELGGRGLNDPDAGLQDRLWTARGVYNETTALVDVVVSAPGVVPTVLFSNSDITELAVSFDQNMNPFVAYHRAGAAFLYWYDPVEEGMVHRAMPEGIRNMRCTLDDKRGFAVANSDIVLSYVRAGQLCARYQRERFNEEHVLRSGIGANAQLVSMAMNVGWRLQWRLRNYVRTDDPGALVRVEPILADVVQDLCIRAGVPRARIDVTELFNDVVPGLRIATEEGLDKPITALMQMFQFGKSQHSGRLNFPKRGRSPVARIPYLDLRPKDPSSLAVEIDDEQELPRQIDVNHIDSEGGFAKNKQTAHRRSNTVHSKKTEKIESEVVLTPDQGATLADRRLKVRWGEQVSFEFTTTIKYSHITPEDVVMVEDARGTWHRVRIEEKNEDDGVIDFEARQDAGERVYGSAQRGNGLPPPVSTTPGIVGDTIIEIINASPLFDQDDELGLYVAAAGVPGSTWAGYQLMVSIDGGVSYTEAHSGDLPSVIGESVEDLPAEPGHDIASAETFEVTTNFPLESVTPAQILTGANRFCLGDEIGQFESALLLGREGPLYHYALSGLHRAKYGTSALMWPAGTRFVMLDESVAFIRIQRSMIGLDIEYKPVTYGHSTDDTTPIDYLFDEPASQTEWAPEDVAATRDGVTNDVTVTFAGRPRLGQFGVPFHSKYFRGYRVRFSNDHVIDTMAESVVYPAAPAGLTVRVCALNEITGEGPYSDPELT